MKRRMRLRKQPVQTRAQGTMEALLDATLQVLVRDGYGKLTTTRVAERAGVSVGTLYQYYPDKRSLVMALEIRYFGLMVEAVERAVREAAAADVAQLLRCALDALLSVKRDNLALTKALREPMAEADGLGFMRDALQKFAAVLIPLVAVAAPGAPRVAERAALLVAALEGAISHAVYEQPAWLSEGWFLDQLVALAQGYLAGPHTAGAGPA